MSLLAKIFLYLLPPIFLILFLVGGCSFKYIDPQYYTAKKLCEIMSGHYIYDLKLYDEIRKNHNDTLSNGYILLSLNKSYDLSQEYKIIPTKYARVVKFINDEYFYMDKNNSKNLIYQEINIGYNGYGLWLSGDEGNALRFNKTEILTCEFDDYPPSQFILKNDYWKQIRKQKCELIE